MLKSNLTFHLKPFHLPYITKSEGDWFSTIGLNSEVAEGDPTLFMRTFGDLISEYFGFKKIDEHTLQVPDAKYFNSQAALLNKRLAKKEKIALSFYETSEGVESTENYLRRFVEDLALPIAAKGSVAIHDVTFHYGGIFFPSVCLVSGVLQSKLILNFIDALPAEEALLKQALFDEAVFNIDAAMGNFTMCYLKKSKEMNPFWILSREGYSAHEYLNSFVREVCRMRSLTVPEPLLQQHLSEAASPVYMLDLHVSIDDFYHLTHSRVNQIVNCLTL